MNKPPARDGSPQPEPTQAGSERPSNVTGARPPAARFPDIAHLATEVDRRHELPARPSQASFVLDHSQPVARSEPFTLEPLAPEPPPHPSVHITQYQTAPMRAFESSLGQPLSSHFQYPPASPTTPSRSDQPTLIMRIQPEAQRRLVPVAIWILYFIVVLLFAMAVTVGIRRACS